MERDNSGMHKGIARDNKWKTEWNRRWKRLGEERQEEWKHMERRKVGWWEVRKRNYNEGEETKVHNVTRISWRNPTVTPQVIISLWIWSLQSFVCGPAVLKQSFCNLDIRIEYFGSRHPLISSSEETFAFPPMCCGHCARRKSGAVHPRTRAPRTSVFPEWSSSSSSVMKSARPVRRKWVTCDKNILRILEMFVAISVLWK